MKKNNQEQSDSINQNDFFDKMLVNYIDSVARGLIAFFLSLLLVSFVLVGYFHLSFMWVLPIVFLFSFALTPFLSKIKLGERFKNWYINKLKNFIK